MLEDKHKGTFVLARITTTVRVSTEVSDVNAAAAVGIIRKALLDGSMYTQLLLHRAQNYGGGSSAYKATAAKLNALRGFIVERNED